MASRLVPNAAFPQITVSKVGGGDLALNVADKYNIVFVYRGKHCPVCQAQLKDINNSLKEFNDLGFTVYAISADGEEKATSLKKELELNFDIGYNLTVDQMNTLGLYVSTPTSEQETDKPFSETAFFVIDPENNLQTLSISNSPFVRPDLQRLIGGLKYTLENKYPTRGI